MFHRITRYQISALGFFAILFSTNCADENARNPSVSSKQVFQKDPIEIEVQMPREDTQDVGLASAQAPSIVDPAATIATTPVVDVAVAGAGYPGYLDGGFSYRGLRSEFGYLPPFPPLFYDPFLDFGDDDHHRDDDDHHRDCDERSRAIDSTPDSGDPNIPLPNSL